MFTIPWVRKGNQWWLSAHHSEQYLSLLFSRELHHSPFVFLVCPPLEFKWQRFSEGSGNQNPIRSSSEQVRTLYLLDHCIKLWFKYFFKNALHKRCHFIFVVQSYTWHLNWHAEELWNTNSTLERCRNDKRGVVQPVNSLRASRSAVIHGRLARKGNRFCSCWPGDQKCRVYVLRQSAQIRSDIALIDRLIDPWKISLCPL